MPFEAGDEFLKGPSSRFGAPGRPQIGRAPECEGSQRKSSEAFRQSEDVGENGGSGRSVKPLRSLVLEPLPRLDW